MSFVIYNIESTVILRTPSKHVRCYTEQYGSEAAAKAGLTHFIKKTGIRQGMPSDVMAELKAQYAIAEKDHFHKNIEKTRMTRNMLNPSAGEFAIPVNTPSCCDPGSEVYHCM